MFELPFIFTVRLLLSPRLGEKSSTESLGGGGDDGENGHTESETALLEIALSAGCRCSCCSCCGGNNRRSSDLIGNTPRLEPTAKAVSKRAL